MPSAEFPGATPPQIPDYKLLRKIGRGAFGDVWIGQNITGAWRAIKLVWKDRFTSADPYDREFRGLKNFADVSLRCARQLALLHVGRNEEAGFFYSVMELADDVQTGREINPHTYVPLTLRELHERKGRLPAAEVIRIGIDMADALRELHDQRLIHRDIKPSNIILVGGVPKLADIGLVTHEEDHQTVQIGTAGYLPPEGPGKPQADIYAMGKVLYELSTGMDRKDYPRLPPNLSEWPDVDAFFELNAVIGKACDESPLKRFATAADLLQELRLLQGGKSVIRLRFAERWVGHAIKASAVLGILLFILSLLFLREKAAERAQRERLADSYRQSGFRLANDGDAVGSIPWVVRASKMRPEKSPGSAYDFNQLYLSLQQSPNLEVLYKYPRPIIDVRFSPDSRQLVVATQGGSLDVWNLGERQRVLTLKLPRLAGATGESDVVEARQIQFTPDGRWLACSGSTNGVYLFDMTATEVPPLLLPTTLGATALSISDDQRFLMATTENAVWVWDLPQRALLQRWPAKGVFMAGFAPKSTRIAATFNDSFARLYDFPDKSAQPTLVREYPHFNWAYTAAFSPDGAHLATACADQSVYVWNTSQTNLLFQLPHSALVFDARYSTNGQHILTRAHEGYLRRWNVHNVRGLPLTLPQPETALGADISPNGERIASGGEEGLLRIWNVETHAAEPIQTPSQLLFSAGEWTVVTNQGSLMQVPLSTGPQAQVVSLPWQDVLAYNRDAASGAQLVCIQRGSHAEIHWTQPSPRHQPNPPHVLKTPGPCLHVLNVNLALGRLLFRGETNRVELLDLNTGKALFSTQLADTMHSRARLHPGGDWMTIEATNSVLIVNAKTGVHVATVGASESQSPFFKTISAFSPDGRYLAVSGANVAVETGPVLIYEFRKGEPVLKPIHRLMAHTDGVCGLAFSPNSQILVTVGEDRKAYAWETRTWSKRHDAMRHDGEVWWAAISADNRVLMTACESHPGITDTLRLWDLETATPLSSQSIVGNYDISKIGYVESLGVWGWTTRSSNRYTFDPGRVFAPKLSPKDTAALMLKAEAIAGYSIDDAGNHRPIPVTRQLEAHNSHPQPVTISLPGTAPTSD